VTTAARGVRAYQDGTPGPTGLPTDTRDPKYSDCTNHHPACFCREAVLAEDYNELHIDWELRGSKLRAVQALIKTTYNHQSAQTIKDIQAVIGDTW